jgi:hypothetical protein
MLFAGIAALALSGAGWAADKDNAPDFSLQGYYRTRGYVLKDFYPDQEEAGKMMVHRLRLQPVLDFQGRAKFIMMADAMDDVVWGDNASLAATSVFAGDPSNTGTDGATQSSFELKRAWMEVKLPIGLIRVGRQESNWGMGLLSNHGNGFDDTFGENHYGSTFDRAIFATRPVPVAQTLMGKAKVDSNHPLLVAVGVDRLVEDPLTQYYGYACEKNLIQGDSDKYDSRCDTDGDGITDLEHDFTDESRTPEQRQADWVMDNADDVWETVFVVQYKVEDANLGKKKGKGKRHKSDLTLGTYVVSRHQDETNSDVLITDVYGKFLHRGVYLEGEVLNIRGRTEGVTLRGSYDPYGELANPLYKEANIWGYVGRAGYKKESYSAIFETGYASGDENVADDQFTGRPIHPDYNVGLILYEEVLARVTAQTWSRDAEGLWSNGGVYNSRYVFPTVTYKPGRNMDLIAGYLLAWPDKPDGSRILCMASDFPGEEEKCTDPQEDLAQEIGWEVDIGFKYKFYQHILFSAEYGYAKVSNRIPLENIGLNPDGKFQTFQSRIAYEF